MRGDRQARVHRYDAAGLEYSGCGKRRFGGQGANSWNEQARP